MVLLTIDVGFIGLLIACAILLLSVFIYPGRPPGSGKNGMKYYEKD